MFGIKAAMDRDALREAMRYALDEELKSRGILLAQRRRAGRPSLKDKKKVAEQAVAA